MNNSAYMNDIQNKVYKYFKQRFETDVNNFLNDLKNLNDIEQIKVLGFIQTKDYDFYKKICSILYGGKNE